MTDNDQDRLIPLELTLDALTWLRAFLNEERLMANADYKKVEALHSELAIRSAQKALSSEHTQMTKIITAIDETVKAVDAHESLARQIDAMTPPAA